jgi:hypothetical protein
MFDKLYLCAIDAVFESPGGGHRHLLMVNSYPQITPSTQITDKGVDFCG